MPSSFSATVVTPNFSEKSTRDLITHKEDWVAAQTVYKRLQPLPFRRLILIVKDEQNSPHPFHSIERKEV
jgi:hypothetical protein